MQQEIQIFYIGYKNYDATGNIALDEKCVYITRKYHGTQRDCDIYFVYDKLTNSAIDYTLSDSSAAVERNKFSFHNEFQAMDCFS